MTIHIWRTKDRAEVDFILKNGLDLIPIEAKYTNLDRIEIQRSYRNFLIKYLPKKGYIINLGKGQKTLIGNTSIQFISYYEFIMGKIIS
jgi:predicted AAA+ superfamily ATPase